MSKMSSLNHRRQNNSPFNKQQNKCPSIVTILQLQFKFKIKCSYNRVNVICVLFYYPGIEKEKEEFLCGYLSQEI